MSIGTLIVLKWREALGSQANRRFDTMFREALEALVSRVHTS